MNKVLKYIQQQGLIAEGDHIVVGVSGGADSICLLFVLKEISAKLNFTMSAVHVNHHLRGEESVRDETFTEEMCKQLAVPCQVYHYEVEKLAGEWNMSIEEAGRAVRREAFDQHCKWVCENRRIEESGKIKVALAHHQNDIAETMLYHLARGTDLAGLVAMRPARGNYIRPLLCINRQEIEYHLKVHKIPYVTDSTNAEDLYTRNKIRHHVLAYLEEFINPQAAAHMAETSGSLGEVWDFLQDLYQEKFLQYAHTEDDGIFLEDALCQEKPLVVKGVLRLAMESLTGNLKNISRVHIASAAQLFAMHVGKEISLPYKMRAERRYQGIFIKKYSQMQCSEKCQDGSEAGLEVPVMIQTEIPLQIPGETCFGGYRVMAAMEAESLEEIPEKTYTKWFDYDKIKGTLVLRYRKTGDYLVVNAQGGRKKLKDYFINQKIPQKERDRIPLLCCGDHVAWVCGHRISELYKVEDSSKRILKVQISAIHRDE